MRNETAAIPDVVRTPAQLKAARQVLGLSAEGLARVVRVADGRVVRRWESGKHEIPGSVTVILETALDFLRQRDAIAQQIEALHSGKQRVGTISWGNIQTDDTADSIARLVDAKASLDDALAILLRQPLSDSGVTNQVHWYQLRRMTPKYSPPEEDDWSVPGETSGEAALAYFEKYAGFGHRLALCEDGDPTAEFVLEQWQVVRMLSGAHVRLQRGEFVASFPVRRA
jgi:hypothetical protein